VNANWRKKRNRVRWEGIVKVQRPIVTNGSMTYCLIYNEERSIMTQLPLDAKAMKQTFPKDELKTYWKATLKYNGIIQLHERVAEPSW
jgi:hypothetical protein